MSIPHDHRDWTFENLSDDERRRVINATGRMDAREAAMQMRNPAFIARVLTPPAPPAETPSPMPVNDPPDPRFGEMPAMWQEYSTLLRQGKEPSEIARMKSVKASSVNTEVSRARQEYGEMLFPTRATRKKIKTP